MIDLKQLQEKVWANKMAKGFNTTSVEQEFVYAYGELSEAYQSYRLKKDDIGEELADVVLFVLSLAKMTGVDLEAELERKAAKNEKRAYAEVDGRMVRVKEAE